MPCVPIAEAARILRGGGCVVYPTETYFALGALASHAAALERIVAIKARPACKPLPVLVGEPAHFQAVVSETFATGPLWADCEDLMRRFWPGPLSLVVPCRDSLPGRIKDGAGRVSVRWTPHPAAAALCRLVGEAIVATSANRSGEPPAATPEALDPVVVAAADGLMTEGPMPAGGPASTVAGLLGEKRLCIYREGAVPLAALRAAGYAPQPSPGRCPGTRRGESFPPDPLNGKN